MEEVVVIEETEIQRSSAGYLFITAFHILSSEPFP